MTKECLIVIVIAVVLIAGLLLYLKWDDRH